MGIAGKSFRSKAVLCGLISVGVFVLVSVFRLVGGMQSLELGTYDLFLKLLPKEAEPSKVMIIGIDDDDIRDRGRFHEQRPAAGGVDRPVGGGQGGRDRVGRDPGRPVLHRQCRVEGVAGERQGGGGAGRVHLRVAPAGVDAQDGGGVRRADVDRVLRLGDRPRRRGPAGDRRRRRPPGPAPAQLQLEGRRPVPQATARPQTAGPGFDPAVRRVGRGIRRGVGQGIPVPAGLPAAGVGRAGESDIPVRFGSTEGHARRGADDRPDAVTGRRAAGHGGQDRPGRGIRPSSRRTRRGRP